MFTTALAITLAVIGIMLWLRWRKKQVDILEDLGIPGPKPSLLFGNVRELRKNPFECIDTWIAKYGEIFGYYIGPRPYIVVSDPHLLKEIQHENYREFMHKPTLLGRRTDLVYRHQINNMRGQHWKQARSILLTAFNEDKTRTVFPLTKDSLDTFMNKVHDEANEGHTFDIHDKFEELIMELLGRTCFGVDTQAQMDLSDQFLKYGDVFLKSTMNSWLSLLSLSFPEFRLIFFALNRLKLVLMNSGVSPRRRLIRMCRDVIKLRRKDKNAKRNDILQNMMDTRASDSILECLTANSLTAGHPDSEKLMDVTNEEPEGPHERGRKKVVYQLTERELSANALLYLLIGQNTTVSTLSFATYLLVKNPLVQKTIQEELDKVVGQDEITFESVQKLQYLDQVLSETLRLYVPLSLLVNRQAVADTTLHGMTIPKNSSIQVPVYHLHHNPKYWPDPNSFNPERFSPANKDKIDPLTYQPFGFGPRNCIAKNFVKVVIKMILANLLQKYNLQRNDVDQEAEIDINMILMRPKNGMLVNAVPRKT